MEQIYDSLPCSALRVSLETEGNGQSHPFAPWSKCKKRSRREHLRLRFDPFFKASASLNAILLSKQRRRFTIEASGSRTKPDSPYSNASDPIKEAPHCQSLHRTTAARVRATLTAERAV